MPGDPIVEEVRAIRRQIEAECGNDWDRYIKHVLEVQEKHKERLIDREGVEKLRQAPPLAKRAAS